MPIWGPYEIIEASPVVDDLDARYSNYFAHPKHQPTPTTCLAASFDYAARSLGAAASFVYEEVTEELAPSIGPKGLRVPTLLQHVCDKYRHLAAREAKGRPSWPTSNFAVVLLVPGGHGRIGHAMALTQECPRGLVFDPWPKHLGGGHRHLRDDEAARWEASGCWRIEMVRQP